METPTITVIDGVAYLSGQPVTPEESERLAVAHECFKRGWSLGQDSVGWYIYDDLDDLGHLAVCEPTPTQAFHAALLTTKGETG